jgi:hypothetical protein
MESGEHEGISRVCFHPDARSFGGHGGCDDVTFDPLCGEMAVDFIPAGSGLIDDAEFASSGLQFTKGFIQGDQIAADTTMAANFAVSSLISCGNFD